MGSDKNGDFSEDQRHPDHQLEVDEAEDTKSKMKSRENPASDPGEELKHRKPKRKPRGGSVSASESESEEDSRGRRSEKRKRRRRESSDSDSESEEERGNRRRRKREKGGRKSRRRYSSEEDESESGSDDESSSEYSDSESSGSEVGSESEEERRRRKRKEKRRREREEERDRKRRKREKEKRRRRKEREEERKKKEKKKKQKKKEKMERGKKGAVTNSWGRYGVLRETDMWNKRPEFTAWLAEVKQVNLESLSNWEEKKMFKEYMEDYNTATFPSKKYYNLDAYFQRKMEKDMKRGFKKVVETERTVFNDEEQRRIEMMREREKQKEQEVEALKRSMQSGLAQAMKEQQQLKEEMAYQYKIGNFEAAAAIQRRLDPDAAM